MRFVEISTHGRKRGAVDLGDLARRGVIELNWRARGIGHIWSPLDVPGLSETGRDVI